RSGPGCARAACRSSPSAAPSRAKPRARTCTSASRPRAARPRAPGNTMPRAMIDWTAVGAEAVDLLRAYLQIDTTNPPGNEIAGARFLADVLQRAGIESRTVESAPGRANLVARVRGHGPLGGIEIDPHKRAPFASIIISEKTGLPLSLTAVGTPGHGSMPWPDTAPHRLIRALARLLAAERPPRVLPEVQEYFRALARVLPPEESRGFDDLAASLRDPARDPRRLHRQLGVPAHGARRLRLEPVHPRRRGMAPRARQRRAHLTRKRPRGRARVHRAPAAAGRNLRWPAPGAGAAPVSRR